MKRLYTILCLAVCFLTFYSNTFANIRRVGFTSSITPVGGLDYPNFQAAHDSANVGDTIQLYPANVPGGSYYNANINKRLVILGCGYYYNSYNLPVGGLANTGLQLLGGVISRVDFMMGLGSAGTIIEGINSVRIATSSIPDSLNNITVLRCGSVYTDFNNSGVCNNWIFSQNLSVDIEQRGYDVSFKGNRSISNLRIENCLGVQVNYYGSTGQTPVGINSGQILNSIFTYYYGLHLNNSVFLIQNCIDYVGALTNPSGCANSIFTNNVTSAASANNLVFTNPGCSGNIFNVSFDGNSVFVGYPTNNSGNTTLNSPDGAFRLATNSIAKNAGFIPGTNTPTDCGIYGGLNPYKPSGIPPVPSFYRLDAASSQATSSPYTLTLSVRSNN